LSLKNIEKTAGTSAGLINRIGRRKPFWLNKRVDFHKAGELKELLGDLNLSTICQSAFCPNISECFSAGRITFLILGDVCTRNCRFCGVKKGKTKELDPKEPQKVAEAVSRVKEKYGLRHIVITSVTRDDLEDGGAKAFKQVVEGIKKRVEDVTVEVLIPDFKGRRQSLKTVISAKPDIIGHNIETVQRLYFQVRAMADYNRSLKVLKSIKEISPDIYTKSGIMLGLGEDESELLESFSDLRRAGCDFLSLGQYLQPSLIHYPVKRYIPPEEFEELKSKAQGLGFLYVASGPYVRSSYLAEEYLTHSVQVANAKN